MAISLGQAGTADSVDAEYFNWESGDRRFMVHMHLDAIDGLARDAIENSEGLPVEVGGILLGQVGRGDRPWCGSNAISACRSVTDRDRTSCWTGTTMRRLSRPPAACRKTGSLPWWDTTARICGRACSWKIPTAN